jgi:DnaJ family protein C protein 16
MTRQYNINVYAPTILIFKEHINKPADMIQVCENHRASRILHI